jgi:Mor family transcriptional regulator
MSTPVKNRKLILGFIYLFPALVALFIILNKTFPSQTYSFESKNLDQSNIILAKNNVFALAPLHDFKKIKLAIKFKPKDETDQPTAQPIKVTVKKGFPATFYPLKENGVPPVFEIKKYTNRFYLITESEKKLIPTVSILKSYGENIKIESMSKKEFDNLPLSQELAGFLDGTLIKYQESIFVISLGEKIAIFSPRVFDTLKYNWDKVIPIKKSEARIHHNLPDPLRLSSAHPDGTILKDISSEKYFLIDKGERIELSQKIYEKYYSTIAPVQTSINYEEKTTTLDKDNTCILELNKSLKAKEGNAYYFTLPDEIQITNLKVTFSRSFSWENIKKLARKFR